MFPHCLKEKRLEVSLSVFTWIVFCWRLLAGLLLSNKDNNYNTSSGV